MGSILLERITLMVKRCSSLKHRSAHDYVNLPVKPQGVYTKVQFSYAIFSPLYVVSCQFLWKNTRQKNLGKHSNSQSYHYMDMDKSWQVHEPVAKWTWAKGARADFFLSYPASVNSRKFINLSNKQITT